MGIINIFITSHYIHTPDQHYGWKVSDPVSARRGGGPRQWYQHYIHITNMCKSSTSTVFDTQKGYKKIHKKILVANNIYFINPSKCSMVLKAIFNNL